MATYPGGIVSITDPISTDKQNAPSHSAQHTVLDAETVAIETELGLTPSGGYATVVLRLDGVDTAVGLNTSHRVADGSSHTFIDQSVVSGATPTFTATNITGVPAASILAGTFGTGAFVFDNTVSGITTLTATSLAGTITTAAQGNITSLGTITSLVATTADINAGTFDGIVGGTTPADGSFTTLSTSAQASPNTLEIGGSGSIVTTIENNDSLGTSDTKLCTQGNVKAYADAIVSTGIKSVQIFTSTGTWTRPSGITMVMVELVGGGGGGGAPSGTFGSGGGGGGGYSRELIDVTSVSTVTTTIGALGSGKSGGGGSGTDGGTTTFVGYCSATGGSGGSGNSDGAGGAPGVGSDGDINTSGNGGGTGAIGDSGCGGSSLLGGGAQGTVSGNGVASTGYGGGGSGGNTGSNGGNGKAGVIIVTEY